MEEMVDRITNTIQESALATAGRHREQKNEKLKSKTKTLLKRRREMIDKGTPRTSIEYAEICKTIRKLVRDDIREYIFISYKNCVLFYCIFNVSLCATDFENFPACCVFIIRRNIVVYCKYCFKDCCIFTVSSCCN